MSLIKSISGIRGTIGGVSGDNLTPFELVKFVAAYSNLLKQKNPQKQKLKVVVGRDARISGEMLNRIVSGTLMSMGIDVEDVGLSTTPTVEMQVLHSDADGGIIITASHNPYQWNALKLLNEKGEFLSEKEGEKIVKTSEDETIVFSNVDHLGKVYQQNDAIENHIQKILELKLVNVEAIRKRNFKVVIDCVNSTGGLALPPLLKSLGVNDIHVLYGEPTGKFPHNPEPLPEHLHEICNTIKNTKADVGFVVDPDVDRLAIIQEDGTTFGEEYTLVAVADYVLQNTVGNTVSNLSSSKALSVVTEKHGGNYVASAVGEVNVVEKMKETHAIIGGEGNGGVIYPELHYGRDALVGIALFLSYLAKLNISCSQLRNKFPNYFISKNKIELNEKIDVDNILLYIKDKYKNNPLIDIDGVRIDFDDEWVHLRKSNTEPIIRIYAESKSEKKANELAQRIIKDVEMYVDTIKIN
ncbi:MAG: phosphoglucosamine mutase [Bacteroidales bacterium]|nr:phosphoglucosamine mutase [Bacteroidales bacterium]